MRKVIVASVISLLLLGGLAFAAERPNQGKCVSDCVQAFNKSLKDKGINPDEVVTFSQKECVEWCKTNPGGDYFWNDGITSDTSTTGETTETDDTNEGTPTGGTVGLPSGTSCRLGSQCMTGTCVIPAGSFVGTCL